MLNSKLRNKYLTGNSEHTRLHMVTDSKKFWKAVKPVFQYNVKTCITIFLFEKLLLLRNKKNLL